MKLLNLGCGQKYHKDWINIDFVSHNENVLQHNLLDGIPLKDDDVEVVYHSHVLEHFSKHDGFHFMEECYRVLNKEGIIRVAVPDLEIIAREYIKNLELALEGDNEAKHNYDWIKLELFDQTVRNESGGEMKHYLYQPIIQNEAYVFERIGSEGKIIRESYLNQQLVKDDKHQKKQHQSSFFKLIFKKGEAFIRKIKASESPKNMTQQELKALEIGSFRLGGEVHLWMYDRYSLSELLKKVGFTEIKLCSAFESEISNWEKYQLDVINGVVRKPDSLFMEAKKLS